MVHQIEHGATRGRNRLLAVGIVILVVLLTATAAVMVLLGPDGQRDERRAVSGTAADAAGTDSESDHQGRLDGVVWTEWQGLRLPTSSRHGPLSQLDSGRRALRFAHTTPGAVLAAIHISVRSQMYAGPQVYRPTIQEQMTGPDVQAYLAQVESDYEAARLAEGLGRGEALPQPSLEFRGWQAAPNAGSRDEPLPVRLFVATYDGSVQRCGVVTITMRWREDDWVAVAPLDGEGSNGMQQISCATDEFTMLPMQG